METIIKKSQELYKPEKQLSIDESMIKYKGENQMRVYIIGKPIQRKSNFLRYNFCRWIQSICTM